MENITMTNTTQITGVRFAFPQAADRGLTTGVGTWNYAPMHKRLSVKDVAQFRSGRPPV